MIERGLASIPLLAFDRQEALFFDGARRLLPPGVRVSTGESPIDSPVVDLLVFPNPTSGSSTIHLVSATDAEVAVVLYDALGRELVVLLSRFL